MLFLFAFGVIETKTHAPDVFNALPAVQLLTQAAYADGDGVGFVAGKIIAPHIVTQLFMRQYPPCLRGQQIEQIKLPARIGFDPPGV